MKQLNIYFEDSEYKELNKIKRSLKITWHDLFMRMAEERVVGVMNNDNKDKD